MGKCISFKRCYCFFLFPVKWCEDEIEGIAPVPLGETNSTKNKCNEKRNKRKKKWQRYIRNERRRETHTHVCARMAQRECTIYLRKPSSEFALRVKMNTHTHTNSSFKILQLFSNAFQIYKQNAFGVSMHYRYKQIHLNCSLLKWLLSVLNSIHTMKGLECQCKWILARTSWHLANECGME